MLIHYSIAEGNFGLGCSLEEGKIRLKPLIVLVHGALTDASIWNSVAEQLQRNGYATLASVMPLPAFTLTRNTYLRS
jgi:hypothetical protein